MPRPLRKCPAGWPVHVLQRGNNRQACFAREADFKAFAHWLHEAALKFDVEIHGWVFMTNHVHLLMTPKREAAISRCMQTLGRHYVRYFNFHYQRTGTLYEGRFKSCIVQTRLYLLTCLRYIELNPVRAGIVNDPADYPWSSYRAHALGVRTRMLRPHPEYQALGKTCLGRAASWRELVRSGIHRKMLSEIRHSTQTGLALGDAKFKKDVERLTGQRQTHLKRGPRPRVNPSARDEFLL